MSELDLTQIANASISTPAGSVTALFVDTDGKLKTKAPSTGTVTTLHPMLVTSTATAGTTTTLTNTSTHIQIFTGSTIQTVKLPDATTIQAGSLYEIRNDSTGLVTLQDGNAGAITILPAKTEASCVLVTAGSIGGTWEFEPEGYNVDTTDVTKKLVFTTSGNGTGITTTIATTSSTSQTLSLPNISGADTVATLGLAQTFSVAKTFSTAPIMTAALPSISKWANIAVVGAGLPPIYGSTLQKAETTTADASVLTYTPPAVAGLYRLNYNVDVTSATSGVVSLTVTYTDSYGTAQTAVGLPLVQQGASPTINSTFTISAAAHFSGTYNVSVNNAAAAILVKWVGGGTIAAKVSVVLEQLA